MFDMLIKQIENHGNTRMSSHDPGQLTVPEQLACVLERTMSISIIRIHRACHRGIHSVRAVHCEAIHAAMLQSSSLTCSDVVSDANQNVSVWVWRAADFRSREWKTIRTTKFIDGLGFTVYVQRVADFRSSEWQTVRTTTFIRV